MPGAFAYTPGPRHLFIRFRTENLPRYLGTCVLAPEPEHEKFKLPVMNDIAGRSVPFQLVDDGESAQCVAVLNRFDLVNCRLWNAVESGGAALGSQSGIARGTLVIGSKDVEFTIVNGFAGNGVAVTGGPDLLGGRLYYSANLRKYKESTAGSRVLEVAFAIDMQGIYNRTTRGFQLYTEVINSAAFLALLT
jgi:hypothetical protein